MRNGADLRGRDSELFDQLALGELVMHDEPVGKPINLADCASAHGRGISKRFHVMNGDDHLPPAKLRQQYRNEFCNRALEYMKMTDLLAIGDGCCKRSERPS